jgi:ParB family transcriptional regulator, chromosome partitioning protein
VPTGAGLGWAALNGPRLTYRHPAEAYEAAGGVIARDLFQHDGGGWFEDVARLDRLAQEKLDAMAAEVRAEGWKWLEVALDFPYGHTTGLRRVAPVARR